MSLEDPFLPHHSESLAFQSASNKESWHVEQSSGGFLFKSSNRDYDHRNEQGSEMNDASPQRNPSARRGDERGPSDAQENRGAQQGDQNSATGNAQNDEGDKSWKVKSNYTAREIIRHAFLDPCIQTTQRKVFMSGQVRPVNAQSNTIKNTKYNIITFVPIVLFNQFKYFFNLFFLLMALTQFYKPLKIGYMFTYYAPLVLVLTLTMIKEAYDDLKRWQRDKEANNEAYGVIDAQSGTLVPTASALLRVGHIIEIRANQRVPADVVLLHTTEESGTVFIRTDQLDGETDWKLRKAVRFTQDAFSHADEGAVGAVQRLAAEKCYIKAREPITNIYDFAAVFKYRPADQEAHKEALSLENTMWANTVLSSGRAFGVVVYCGYETRMAMNSRKPQSKFGKTDDQINLLSKLLFVLMLLLSGLLLLLRPAQPLSAYIGVDFFRYLILMSNVIPISLKVNLDFAKLVYSFRITNDKTIPGTVARNSVIPEELGRVQYVLSDKTGTLTQNDMVFKRLSLEAMTFTHEDCDTIRDILQQQCHKHRGPMPDYQQLLDKRYARQDSASSAHSQLRSPSAIHAAESDREATLNQRQSSNTVGSMLGAGGAFIASMMKASGLVTPYGSARRHPDVILRDLITAMAVCHNVTPTRTESGEREFQASSPDEVALVLLAEQLGMQLQERTQSTMRIKNALDEFENYEILNVFPFSSETKRMGIVVQNRETNTLIFFMKGADVIMKQFLPEVQRGYVDEECDNLAREGLRTLVFAQRPLSDDEYTHWARQYKRADEQINNRRGALQDAVALLEHDMEFLGVSGVEDKLQEDVAVTLENVRNAGIKVWMLTGDKVETAVCIAISSGLKANQHQIVIYKEVTNAVELRNLLTEFAQCADRTLLVLDGTTLRLAMEELETEFFEVACRAPAVVCCRCSPTQKSQVVEAIKRRTRKITCAIGDGGNDVGMIQMADVGIGIVGKEGKQAALAADYSIEKFKYLNELFLWHGRLSYKRTALLTQFIFHRGLIITICEMVFICIFYFVSFQIFNSKLMLGFSTIFTMFPVFALIFDEDVNKDIAIKYPPLYRTLQKGREVGAKSFLAWLCKAIYQGTVILLVTLALFQDSFLDVQTIAFSALIITEYLMTISELNRIHIVSIVSCLLSLIVYLLIWFCFPKFFELVPPNQGSFFWKLLVIVLASWIPLYAFDKIRKRCSPNDYEQLVKTVRGQGIVNLAL